MTGARILVAAAIALSLVSGGAKADRASEFDGALRSFFDSIDTNRDGRLDGDEIASFADAVFAELDSDRDRRLAREEFARFDFGLRELAARHDRQKLHADARERIWKRWRHPRPGQVTSAAFRQRFRGELLQVSRGSLGVTFAEFRRARFAKDLATAFR